MPLCRPPLSHLSNSYLSTGHHCPANLTTLLRTGYRYNATEINNNRGDLLALPPLIPQQPPHSQHPLRGYGCFVLPHTYSVLLTRTPLTSNTLIFSESYQPLLFSNYCRLVCNFWQCMALFFALFSQFMASSCKCPFACPFARA